jgi:nucleotide-binding universal stress UspA family protein
VFKNVIVGVDEHQGGRDALGLASRLAEHGGLLTFVHVYGGPIPIGSAPGAAVQSAADPDSGKAQRALELLERAREQGRVQGELRAVHASSPGRGLHELAEEVEADLLVVGSSRRGVFGRVTLGDDTQAALNGAPCPVAIAPASYSLQSTAIRRIGVGYNSSRESAHAVAVGRILAGQYDASLSALEVVSLPSYAFAGWTAPLDDHVLDELVDDARKRIVALGGVEPSAVYGVATEELSLYSGSVDLLILGSRDYGPVGRVVHGSTSHQLARHARCPLLVLTRAARDPGRQGSAEPTAAPAP